MVIWSINGNNVIITKRALWQTGQKACHYTKAQPDTRRCQCHRAWVVNYASFVFIQPMSFDEKKWISETVAPREAFKAQLKSERSKHARSGAAAADDNVDLVLNASCLVAVLGSAVVDGRLKRKFGGGEGRDGGWSLSCWLRCLLAHCTGTVLLLANRKWEAVAPASMHQGFPLTLRPRWLQSKAPGLTTAGHTAQHSSHLLSWCLHRWGLGLLLHTLVQFD